MFRTADAAGVSRIILSGYTPTPLDRFNQPRKDFTKVSLGAEKTVPWIYTKNLSATISKLKSQGALLLALEQDPRSVSLFDWRPPEHYLKTHTRQDAVGEAELVLLVGNEVRGISKPFLAKCDTILEIPMRGKKESLNVAVATGVALFALMR